ncbi:hypothetical protein LEL_05693 [Akanthomyces lecanii RCEF 1005]|uniref:Uncharacterized protein n=1 Tax=Akanthomyces lecanii RCEF 1005 TaxID=1081108 RepID=A0A162N5U6_CORDF|nr:hypothetical protein LEL_05693 [Akanthomyces lecanii RCEF 1005]
MASRFGTGILGLLPCSDFGPHDSIPAVSDHALRDLTDEEFSSFIGLLDSAEGDMVRRFGSAASPIVNSILEGNMTQFDRYPLQQLQVEEISKRPRCSESLLACFDGHQKRQNFWTHQKPTPAATETPPPQVSTNDASATDACATDASATDASQQDEAKDCKEQPDKLAIENLPTSADGSPSRRGAAMRDAGVSDEVWEQLQKDTQAEQEREGAYQAKLRAEKNAGDDALGERMVKELIEEEKRRKKEVEMRRKLATGGRCPMGYPWVKQAAGWRCAGGSHFVSDLELSV